MFFHSGCNVVKPQLLLELDPWLGHSADTSIGSMGYIHLWLWSQQPALNFLTAEYTLIDKVLGKDHW